MLLMLLHNATSCTICLAQLAATYNYGLVYPQLCPLGTDPGTQVRSERPIFIGSCVQHHTIVAPSMQRSREPGHMIREAHFHWFLCPTPHNSGAVYTKIQGTRSHDQRGTFSLAPCKQHLISGSTK